jgi:hypothetical protein
VERKYNGKQVIYEIAPPMCAKELPAVCILAHRLTETQSTRLARKNIRRYNMDFIVTKGVERRVPSTSLPLPVRNQSYHFQQTTTSGSIKKEWNMRMSYKAQD